MKIRHEVRILSNELYRCNDVHLRFICKSSMWEQQQQQP